MAKYFNVTPSTCWEWNSMKFTHRSLNEVYLDILKKYIFFGKFIRRHFIKWKSYQIFEDIFFFN